MVYCQVCVTVTLFSMDYGIGMLPSFFSAGTTGTMSNSKTTGKSITP
jgi:hypothetical protein